MKKDNKYSASKKLHRLVKQSQHVSAYDKHQAYQFVRSCLTAPLDDIVKVKVDKYLKRISSLRASLGTDSTDAERLKVKATETTLMGKIREMAPDYYETIKGNND